MTLQTSVEYRYFLTDLLSNEIISEVPFKNVSYERANKKAGGFSGTIPFIPSTKALDLYEATMPGRTGLYVMRNGVCVWGGIIWSRQYNVTSQELSVDGAEFVSYLYHRNIWQTLVYGSEFIGVTAFAISGGVATITTESPHGFSVGQKVRLSIVSPAVDGDYTITGVPAANRFTYNSPSGNVSGNSTSGAVRLLADTFDVARDLVYRINTDLGGVSFQNEVIRPGISFDIPVVKKERSAGVVTLTFNKDHDIIAGQEIDVYEVGSGLDGTHFVTEIPNKQSVRFELSGPDVPPTTTVGLNIFNVTTKSVTNGTARIVLDRTHGAVVGQTVLVEGVDSFFSGILDTTFNGRVVVTAVPSANSLEYFTGAILNQPPTAVSGGTATFGSKVVYGDFGSYVSNADIGVGLNTSEKSNIYRDTLIIRGFQQKTVGEILEDYSNSIDGAFEYRIDCDYDYDTASFTRTFKLLPVDQLQKPELGSVLVPEDYGADKIVFEYPGNIASFTIDESAEESATRFFVVGSIEDMNDEASQPYAGASSTELLSNLSGRSWPLLDQVEQLDGVENEQTLWEYARDYLYESLPPIGTYNIQVNGSLSPIIGTYFPGDWCTIIIDDEFVRQRMATDQEAGNQFLIRKINSYKVSVPDSPTFPETVDLELVTDWKAKTRGE